MRGSHSTERIDAVRRRRVVLLVSIIALLMAGMIPTPSSASHEGTRRWYGLGQELNNGPFSGARMIVNHETIGSTGSTATMKVNCYNNSFGERNFIIADQWAIWRRGEPFVDARYIEWGPRYICGAGESRRREATAEFYWDSTRYYYIYGINNTTTHTYSMTHDHLFPGCVVGVTGAETWWFKIDGAWHWCMYWPLGTAAPHVNDIDTGFEYSNDNGTIKALHHTYTSIERRVAHGGGAWDPISIDAKVIYDPPDGHVGAHMGFGNNSVHACAWPANGSYDCH